MVYPEFSLKERPEDMIKVLKQIEIPMPTIVAHHRELSHSNNICESVNGLGGTE